jgi:hypothetical protein
MNCLPSESKTQPFHRTTLFTENTNHEIQVRNMKLLSTDTITNMVIEIIYYSKYEECFALTSVTLPDKIVNDREENPVVSNPAVCNGQPHMNTSSIADLYNVQREFKSKPS